jgi:hypothetical protein
VACCRCAKLLLSPCMRKAFYPSCLRGLYATLFRALAVPEAHSLTLWLVAGGRWPVAQNRPASLLNHCPNRLRPGAITPARVPFITCQMYVHCVIAMEYLVDVQDDTTGQAAACHSGLWLQQSLGRSPCTSTHCLPCSMPLSTLQTRTICVFVLVTKRLGRPGVLTLLEGLEHSIAASAPVEALRSISFTRLATERQHT